MSQLPIRYSSGAGQNYVQLLEYVREKWGVASARKLDRKIEVAEDRIARNPEMYPASMHQPELRKCVIARQTSLYYIIQPDKIVIVAVFDNRQNPDRLDDMI